MKKAEMMSSIGKAFHRARFQFKKHSPEIFVAAGIVGTVVSTVLACKATTKVGAILDKSKEDVNAVHNCLNDDRKDDSLNEAYSQKDAQKDLTIIYVQTGAKLAKLYAPAVLLGVMSFTCILSSHNILRKRNMALGAAYAAMDKGFKAYRSRVAERFGEEVDRELKYNIKAKKFEETVIDSETGKEKKTKTTVNVTDSDAYSDYARFFDECSSCWEKDSEYNLMFLRAEQNYANDRLKARGYLFLNEVYERLGIQPTKAGQVVGWIYDPEHSNGDNFVDFHIYELNREKNREFVNGYERAILLDFNVDGYILDRIE